MFLIRKLQIERLNFVELGGGGRIMGRQLYCVSGQKKSAITTSGIR